MNPVAEEMRAILEGDEDLKHYGTPRHSGRYPWGSGDEPYQRSMDFLGRCEMLKKQGLSEREIAKELNMLNKKGEPSISVLRREKTYANDMRKINDIQTARSLKEDGLGPTEIGRKMGINESSVRELLNPNAEARARLNADTADFLREQVLKKEMIDITSGVEKELGVSTERLKNAIYILEKEGFNTYEGGIPQPTNPGQQTTQKVLCAPGIEHKDIYDYARIQTISEYTSHDGGTTFDVMQYPRSLDSKRLKVLLADEVGPDGERGVDKDGIIQIRRGVEDLSLGGDRYSQVRILVDDNKYLKGMAVYSDNMPDGVDVIFNSNKTSYEKALKSIKEDDPNNPFGTTIKPSGQSYYIDKDGNRQLSLVNKVRGEGDWSEWTDALPSQFLSKQPKHLIKQQLNLAKEDKLNEYNEICECTNPTVKKFLLNKFADECDAAAVDLKAAALPGQKYHVMIPINTLKENEVYAPQYENGTKLALIRYPHAGTFEIPILTVNNKHESAKKLIGTDTFDAIGLNKKNAERLSGADFDGDTVMCIPTHDPKGKVKIKSTEPLKGLEGFDPQLEYAYRPGMKLMKDEARGTDNTQVEMGKISNLITDMTLFGAPSSEMAKAVRHSMVVIDAGKHKLDYKRSEVENDIAYLKKKWQGYYDEDGKLHTPAATIVSRAKGETTINKKQGSPLINRKDKDWYDPDRPEGSLLYKDAEDLYYPVRKYDKETGLTTITTATRGKKIVYDRKDPQAREQYDPVMKIDEKTGKVTFTNKAGDIEYKTNKRTQASVRMRDTDDAMSLVSNLRHPTEILYAEYANSMKALANQARMEMIHTQDIPKSAAAGQTYRAEVASLKAKINDVSINSIKERAALRKANIEIAAAKEANPNMDKDDLKKRKQQAVTRARSEVGALSRKDRNVEITDKEWEAIQAGAISKSDLNYILNNTDLSAVRKRTTPRATTELSKSQISRIKSLSARGFTMAEIAKKMGKSPSTIQNYLKGEN